MFLKQALLGIGNLKGKPIIKALPQKSPAKHQTFSTRSDPSILIRPDTLIHSGIFVGSWLHLIEQPSMKLPLLLNSLKQNTCDRTSPIKCIRLQHSLKPDRPPTELMAARTILCPASITLCVWKVRCCFLCDWLCKYSNAATYCRANVSKETMLYINMEDWILFFRIQEAVSQTTVINYSLHSEKLQLFKSSVDYFYDLGNSHNFLCFESQIKTLHFKLSLWLIKFESFSFKEIVSNFVII